jgi:hypothetical protein
MSTLQALVVAASLIATAQPASAKDAFDAVKCDGDVAKALVGGKIGDEPAAVIEKRHAAIGLKDEGGDEISDAVFYQSWTICGASYHVLQRDGVVRDAVRADHSKAAPSFVGTCKVDGVETKGPVLAILEAGAAESLPAKSAWRIDETNAKFVAMEAKGLACPRTGIATADGGR